jgi:hypothetical protein
LQVVPQVVLELLFLVMELEVVELVVIEKLHH